MKRTEVSGTGRLVTLAAAIVLALAALGACSPGTAQPSSQGASGGSVVASAASDDVLSLWADDSPTAALVREYVADVTDESSPNYIPPGDRIATIDWDGTLYGELDPIYLDWALYVHRVLWDSTYTPTDEQVEVAHAIEEVERTRVFPEDLEARHAKCLAEAFAGMGVEDFKAYVAEFAATDAPKFTGMRRADAYFLPMVELVDYLHDSGFECYVVSGTDRNVLRVMLPAYFPWLDDAHIKGSVSTVVASGQDGKDGLEYTWTADDEAVLGGELVKDVKANKPAVIATEIGKQPVVSLGNSGGDASMANYAVNNNKYRSIALMLCCDDVERDWGEPDKAAKMAESCEKNGWHAVSERDEWKTIYGEGIERDVNWEWSSEQAGPNRADDAASADSDAAAASAPRSLASIRESGVIRVGTAGDYQPMSYLDPETGAYVGFDAALAEDLAASLGVTVEYVKTSWPTLMDDTFACKFDLAICGITITDDRKDKALMSDGYLENGKTVLCRAEDAGTYTSLAAINKPGVRVMENPGGLNEKFARENLPDTTLVIHDVNQEIPGLVAAGEADVMITEVMEAGYYAAQDSRLAAPLIHEPFTSGQLGALMPKGSDDLLAYVNAFLAKEKASGRIDALTGEYIYGSGDGELAKAA